MVAAHHLLGLDDQQVGGAGHVQHQHAVGGAAQVVLDDAQASGDFLETLGKAGVAQEEMRADGQRVGQHVLHLFEVFALQLVDRTVQPCHDIVVLLADEAVDGLVVEGAHGGLLVGLAGEQDLPDRLALQAAAELEAVDLGHVVIHHHHRNLLEAVLVMHFAVDHVEADVDHMARHAPVVAMPVEGKEAFDHRRYGAGTVERDQRGKGRAKQPVGQARIQLQAEVGQKGRVVVDEGDGGRKAEGLDGVGFHAGGKLSSNSENSPCLERQVMAPPNDSMTSRQKARPMPAPSTPSSPAAL